MDAGAAGPVDLRVESGELVLVHVPRAPVATTLCDAAMGLAAVSEGELRFEGRRWDERSPVERGAARFRIGRVYERTEWIANLNVDENVLLPAFHHTSRPEADLVAAALELAGAFGLEDLPSARPDRMDARQLRIAAMVRAFLGAPQLVLLERPLRGGVVDLARALLETVRASCARGSGVLWFTAERELFDSAETGADRRYLWGRQGPERLDSSAGAPS